MCEEERAIFRQPAIENLFVLRCVCACTPADKYSKALFELFFFFFFFFMEKKWNNVQPDAEEVRVRLSAWLA